MREITTEHKTKPRWQLHKRLSQTFPIFFLVEWIVVGKLLYTGTTVGVFEVQQRLVWPTTAVERFSLFREIQRVSSENYFEVSWSWALQCQFGGPRRLLSSWVSLSSLPWTCSAPTRWAVSMAVMSRWAYLMEPSSGWEIGGRGEEKRKHFCFVFFHLKILTCRTNTQWSLKWPCRKWRIRFFKWRFLHWWCWIAPLNHSVPLTVNMHTVISRCPL